MKKIFIAGCALCWSAFLSAQNIDVNTYRYAGPYNLQMPFMIDSTDVNAKRYGEEQLLNSELSLSEWEQGTLFTGELLPKSMGYALHLIGFTVSNTQYATGKLTVKGPKNYKVYIDGKEPSGALALEPGTHDVIIKYLSRPDSSDSLKVNLQNDKEGLITLCENKTRLYTLSDVMNGKRFSDISLSPNGRFLMTHYATTVKGGQTSYRTQITELASGKVLSDGRTGITWMPRSNRYYYTRQDINGRNLISVDPETNLEQILCTDIPEGSFRIAPTEDYLLYTYTTEGPKERKDVFQVLQPDDRQPGWRNRSYYAKFDLKKKVLQRLTFGYHSAWATSISEDGNSLILQVSEPRITERPFTLTSVYKMDVNTMKIDTLLRNEGFINRCILSPGGQKLLVLGSGEAFKGVGLKIKEGQTSSMVDTQLFLYDIATQKATPLTIDFNPNVGNTEWSTADGFIYFTAENKDCISLYKMNPDNGKIISMNAKEELVKNFSLSKSAPIMVYYGESASSPGRLYSLNTKNLKSTLKEDLGKETLKNIQLGECNTWNFINSRGDTICGRFYLPPNFDATKKYPLIVNYYGGCSPTPRYFESRYPHHAYAALGYVVYVVQPSGATGFGQEFAARHVNTWGDHVADDIIEGTKQFCKMHPYVDREKIGCIGASYGGFMTQYLQTKTDIFAAAISHAGISDITSYWGEGYWGYSYSQIASANSYPWNNPDMFTKQSPLFNADKIHTPILFLHGTDDTNVPVGESIQMFTALKLLGRETAFVAVEGENHHILNYDKRIRWQNTIYAWFSKWLQNNNSWWDSLYPPKKL